VGLGTDLSPSPSVSQLVCLSVQKVYCGKMAHWIWMLFRVVRGANRGMDVLNGVEIAEGAEAILG